MGDEVDLMQFVCEVTGKFHRFARVRAVFCSDTAGDEGIVFEDDSAPATCLDCFKTRDQAINLELQTATKNNLKWDIRNRVTK